MTESEWLNSTNPDAMLRLATGRVSLCCGCMWCNNGNGTVSLASGQHCCSRCDNATPTEGYRPIASDRKLRLFACACARRMGMGDGEIVAVEAWADGGDKPRTNTAYILSSSDAGFAARMYANPITGVALYKRKMSLAERAAFLRDIVGNPFRPVNLVEVIPSRWPNSEYHLKPLYLTPTVRAIAQRAYDERPGRRCERCDGAGGYCEMGPNTFHQTCSLCHGNKRIDDGTLDNDTLAVLADALEDAGCPAEVEQECERCEIVIDARHGGKTTVRIAGVETTLGGQSKRAYMPGCLRCNGTGIVRTPNPILSHLRSPGPHVRGCWVLDLILGKE